MSQLSGRDYKEVALAFAEALATRDYAAAYALTSTGYKRIASLAAMQGAFETIVPLDWKTVDPIVLIEAMEDWPDKEPSDVGWAYVSLGGDLYSEAITVVVAREGDVVRVRTVEFGRP